MAINEYETEEQQIAALKKWWKENSSSLIIGVLVGVTTLFGWRYYNDQNQIHAMQASNLYMQLVQSTVLNTVDEKTIDINNTLINDFSDTPYAALSSLALAKVEYEKDNVEGAIAQLELAAKNTGDEDIKQIANLRLVSIYIEQQKYDAASALLGLAHDAAFDAKYEELKGDLYLAQGDIDKARMAYDNAINLYGASASKLLMLKRQNLGVRKVDSALSQNTIRNPEVVSPKAISLEAVSPESVII
jgi:predicted negative regulator of RcsB-dependent stress response